MAAAEALELDVSELCVRWAVHTRNLSTRQALWSSEFLFKGIGWKLGCIKKGPHYNLHLSKCSGVHPNPIQVSVHLESSESGRMYLHQMKRFTDEFGEGDDFNPIWWKREEEILRVLPEFRLHGILKLAVTLKLDGEECICTTCQFTAADDNVPSLDSFSKDLGNLLDQDASTDVEFRCVDAGENVLATVKAHKLVVCARSPVLASMVQSDMVEGRTGVANIKDIDAEVFTQFFKYLYSGKLEETAMDTAMCLYEAGDRFQVKSLTRHCARRMARKLTIENSCEVLPMADAHSDEEFAEAILAFMVNKKVPQVFDGWDDFCSKHPVLSTRVLDRF